MARKLKGTAIQAGTITVTQLETSVANTVQTGGGPKITSVQVTDNTFVPLDDTAVDTAGGFIKINGSGFVSGCSVIIGSQSASAVSFLSVAALGVTVPALTTGTYTVYVTNPDGSVAIRVNGLNINGVPSWTTAAGLTDQFIDSAISIQLTANSNSTVSYTLQGGSSLPPGITLSNVGLLSGTVTNLVADTTYTFTVVATDQENQDTPRTFTVTIITVQQIARSLRFNSADSTYLNRTPAVAGNQKTFTLSLWTKRSAINSGDALFTTVNGSAMCYFSFGQASGDSLIFAYYNGSTDVFVVSTSAVYRDPSSWYHIVLSVDTTQATAANRVKIYVNGVEQVLAGTSYPSQNYDTPINSTISHILGGATGSYTSYLYSGYIAEVYFVNGQALTPTSFGRTDSITGVWVPMRYTGTYGTNGFYLNFANNASTSSLGIDSSGNNNTWTLNNFSVTAGAGNDSLVDSPSSYGSDTGLGGEVRGNYPTLSPLHFSTTSAVLTNGGLDLAGVQTVGSTGNQYATMALPNSGKWYWEVQWTKIYNDWNQQQGVLNLDNTSDVASIYLSAAGVTTSKNRSGTQTALSPSTISTNDIIQVAIDIDAGKIWFGRNNTWYESGNPSTGANAQYSNLSTTGRWMPFVNWYTSTSTSNYVTCSVNFGQRPFAYAAPSGFKSLNTHNLPALAVTKSNTAFDTVLYTGTGTARTITGFNFGPDLVWVKQRSGASTAHSLQDIVRGADKHLTSNGTDAEANSAAYGGGITAFTGNGFSTGTWGAVNENTQTYVAWAWDAGTTTVVNTAGSITANVRVNSAAGFSIARYTGTGSSASFGHGLSVAPKLVIIKSLGIEDWFTYVGGILGGSPPNYVKLNTTAVAGTSSGIFPSLATSSVVNIGSGSGVGANGVTHIAYSFAEVPGFSAFGTYTGNGSADGPFVYTGFRPRFIIVKNSSSAGVNWLMFDTATNTYNTVTKYLLPNSSSIELTDLTLDIVSNGFKPRVAGGTGINNSGSTYIYAAFAESPFKYARAR
jgi:hypothetical protein